MIICRTSDDVLSADDYQQLLRFVYSSQRPLAAAAGELLYSRYDDDRDNKITKKTKKVNSRLPEYCWSLSGFSTLILRMI